MKRIFLITFFILGISLFAQNRNEDKIKTKTLPLPKEIKTNEIAGVPILSQPYLLTGYKNEIRTEKHGLIYPAFFDWNKDGKKDLLLGEFETGDTGSNIKVYLNEGSDSEPKYSGEYFYATDVKGDTITNHQWCCIGIHPKVIDLDSDGYLDLVSGQYNPGLLSWWRGSEKGFLPRVFIEQEGLVKDGNKEVGIEPWNPDAFLYWNYTSADFGDFNNDGKADLFVGGSDGFRVALNIGSKEKPKFGLRKYLYHVNGEILHIKKPSQKKIDSMKDEGEYPNISGVAKGYVHPVDWDNDGVLDLLVTHEYMKTGHNVIEFFRGVKTDKGLRFEEKRALFTGLNNEKVMPGCQPMISISDFNNDGIKDIVLGISIPTINGFEAVPEVADKWIDDLKIAMPGKDIGKTLSYMGGIEGAKKKLKENPMMKKHMLGTLDGEKYLTLRHRGYLFVLEGKKNEITAVAKKNVVAKEKVKSRKIVNEQYKESKVSGPVSYQIKAPKRYKFNNEFEIEVRFRIKKGWYLYTENPINKPSGFKPTSVKIEFDERMVNAKTDLIKPVEKMKGGAAIYNGDEVVFRQTFIINSPDRKKFMEIGEGYNLVKGKIDIKFQTCNKDLCLKPQKIEEEIEIKMSF